MNAETHEIKDINLQDLIPFRLHSSQTYQGERLEQLMNSIERSGLINPIIVRPIGNEESEKYEILCGHNRKKAMEALGRDVIRAEVRMNLSDEEATELYYDSNLNQQSFADWSYSQKIEAVKYYDKMIKYTSQQGKRTDLERETDKESDNGTSVYTRHKSGKSSKRSTARDKMARHLGISTATFSKYRSIIQLPDDVVESIGQLLDDKMITFEAAYKISGLKAYEIKILLQYAVKCKDKKIDMDKLNLLRTKSKKAMSYVSKKNISEIFVSRNKESEDLIPVHRNKPVESSS